jgi:DUF2971 family protein
MVLYKYLHKYGLRFLANLKLKLTNPADVDDPFEMRPRVGSSEVTEEMVKRLLNDEARIKVFVRALGWPNLDEGMASCRENPQDFRRRLNKNMRENLQAYCDQAPEAVAKGFRMLCFSKLCDNILMWSHYGDSHRGVLVGLERDGLENALEARALEVNCREDRTTYDVEQFLFPKPEYAEQLLTRKSPSWSYQKEVRFIVKYQDQSFFECPPALIQSVYLGCKFPTKRVPCIRKLMKRKNIQAELLQGIPDKDHFRIDFRPISQ